MSLCHFINLFQFHKGTIRTNQMQQYYTDFMYFNSIEVQLELKIGCVSISICKRFQFHKGTIRTAVASYQHEGCIHFNSIKVQLEHIFSLAV